MQGSDNSVLKSMFVKYSETSDRNTYFNFYTLYCVVSETEYNMPMNLIIYILLYLFISIIYKQEN